MERVPPLHGEVDDRHVDHAHDADDARGAVGAALVVNGGVQRDEAEIEEEEDELRRQASVPHPVRAPGRTAPEGAREERDEGHQRARGGHRLGKHEADAVVAPQTDGAEDSHQHVEQHREPGGRDVDEDDAIGVALARIDRAHEEAQVEAHDEEHECQPENPRDDLACEAVEVLRVG